MTDRFGNTLSHLRSEHGLSQQELADQLHVSRSAVANWEAGHRMPSAGIILQIAQALDANVETLLAAADEVREAPNVLLVDDSPIALDGMLPILRDALPGANVVGLSRPTEALDYFRTNSVALALLDIELGKVSGLELCQELLQIQPSANVVFLTAYREYALDAWGTGACGYLLKPLDSEEIRRQIPRLLHPVRGLL